MSQSHCLFSRAASPLCFATSNCCSLSSKIKLEQLGLDLKTYNVDFMASQERYFTLMVYMLYTLNGGWTLYIVSRRLQPYLQTLHVISDHVTVIPLLQQLSPIHLSVLLLRLDICTSPQYISDPRLKEDFYQHLQGAVDSIPKREVIVLMGDTKAKIGKRCSIDT